MLKLAKDQIHLAGYNEYRPAVKPKAPRPVAAAAAAGAPARTVSTGRGGRGAGGGGSSSKPADGADEEVGKVVRDRRLAKIGSELLCVDYGLGKCRDGDTTSGGCKKRGVFMAHRCCVVKDKSKIPLGICGERHDNSGCKHWVP